MTATWPGLKLAGYFTPRNAAFLRDGYGPARTSGDTDLGSGGPTLLPGDVLIAGGKQGRLLRPRRDNNGASAGFQPA